MRLSKEQSRAVEYAVDKALGEKHIEEGKLLRSSLMTAEQALGSGYVSWEDSERMLADRHRHEMAELRREIASDPTRIAEAIAQHRAFLQDAKGNGLSRARDF